MTSLLQYHLSFGHRCRPGRPLLDWISRQGTPSSFGSVSNSFGPLARSRTCGAPRAALCAALAAAGLLARLALRSSTRFGWSCSGIGHTQRGAASSEARRRVETGSVAWVTSVGEGDWLWVWVGRVFLLVGGGQKDVNWWSNEVLFLLTWTF